jgi:Protein of unknown function (DUF4446)
VPLASPLSGRLAVVALLVALAALAVAVFAARRAGRAARAFGTRSRRPRSSTARTGAVSASAGIDELREEVAALRLEASDALRHLAVVRYDAFGDMGGQLSWSMALLDDAGNGMVLTSIHGRSESRSYAKNIRSWSCEQQLSPEETEAIDFVRADQR